MTLICDSCGNINSPGSTVCEKCGAVLNLEPTLGPVNDQENRSKEKTVIPKPIRYSDPSRGHTELGTLMFGIGTLISWIPYVQYIGYILLLIGFIFIFLGRHGFGNVHKRNVNLSLILFIITFVFEFILILWFAFSFANIILQYDQHRTALGPAIASIKNVFNTLLILTLVVAAIGGLTNILLTLELQPFGGKILLIVAFAISIGLSVAMLVLMKPVVSSTLTSVLTNPNSLSGAASKLSAKIGLYKYLGAIPDVMFGAAFLMARQRILSHEI